jgi:hypothetical protein
MGPQREFEQFGNEVFPAFDNDFGDDDFFDFNAACDIPLPSCELPDKLSDHNEHGGSLINTENYGGDQIQFFDSSYASDDMGNWPSGGFIDYQGCIQGEDWALPPIAQVSGMVQASPGDIWSSEPSVLEETQAVPSREAIAAEIARLQALHDATPAKKTKAPKTPPKKRSQVKTPKHTPQNSLTKKARHSRSLSDTAKRMLSEKGPVEQMFGASSSPQERREYQQKMRASSSKNNDFAIHDNVNGFTFHGHDFSLQNEDFALINDGSPIQNGNYATQNNNYVSSDDFNIQNEDFSMHTDFIQNGDFRAQGNGFTEVDNFAPQSNNFMADNSLTIESDVFPENTNFNVESHEFIQTDCPIVYNNDFVQNGSFTESNTSTASHGSAEENRFIENGNFIPQSSDANQQSGNKNVFPQNEPMSEEDALLAERLLAQIAECNNNSFTNSNCGSNYPSYNETEQKFAPEQYFPMMTPPRHPQLLYPDMNPATFHTSLPQTSSPAANNFAHQEQQSVASPTPSKKKTAKKAPAKPRAPKEPKEKKPRSPPKPKTAASATKVTKKTKTSSSSAPHQRTVSAPSPSDRTIKELYNVPFLSLTKDEKARLLLPLLQGIDPNTGLLISTPGTLASQEPDFEAIGADEFPQANGQNSGSMMRQGNGSGNGSGVTGQTGHGVNGGYQPGNGMTSERMTSLQAGNGMIKGVNAEALGRDRQREALERNAMLRAAGRRR